MFSSLLATPCELKLHLLQHVVFLRPPTRRATEDSLPTSTDEVARGLVELQVPQDRRIAGIRVKLRAVQSVAILADQHDIVSFSGVQPIGWEDTVLMEKVVEIGLPPSKSHTTVPGDDSIAASISERRGRSRQARSRRSTPAQSQNNSPRISLDEHPPEYQREANPTINNNNNSSLGAMIRAISRGASSSRNASRTSSQPASRQASRENSPTRSPRQSPNVTAMSQVNSPQASATQGEEDLEALSGHLSRTGLSRGRNNASGAHPHITDRNDYFGLLTTATTNGQGSSSNRSATISPIRTTSRSTAIRDVRAPSADTGSRVIEEESGLFLQKGVHGFEFAFILPANSAPYERSPYGRVRYIIKATAFGAGRAKSNIEAWKDMFPVVNPSADGGPVPLTVLYNDLHPTVGLISIACTSNNISVGGIFNVDIHSPTPPDDLIVYLVRVSVETNTELKTRKKGKQHVPVQRHKLFEKGWVPPRPNDPHGQGDGKRSEGIIRDPTRSGSRPDDAWTVQGIARMPNDNIVRSTTAAGTDSSIRFSHQLLIEVVHARSSSALEKDRKLKVFALRQPIILPSCCVAYDAVVLPPYTPANEESRIGVMPYDVQGSTIRHASHTTTDSRPSTSSNLRGPGHEYCVCGQSFDDLSERERRLMPARSLADLPLNGLTYRKIGELPDTSRSLSIGGLRRSTSRSSSTSRDSRRSISIRRSVSRVRRSPSNGRSPSIARGRNTSVSRITGRRNSAANESNSAGPYANGAGERGEGIIRTNRRGSFGSTITLSAESAPPTYENVIEENVAITDSASNENDSEINQIVQEE